MVIKRGGKGAGDVRVEFEGRKVGHGGGREKRSAGCWGNRGGLKMAKVVRAGESGEAVEGGGREGGRDETS